MRPVAVHDSEQELRATTSERPAGHSRRLRPSATGALALMPPLGLFLLSRAAVIFAALASTWIERTLTVTTDLTGWDGYWYLKIARTGYPHHLVTEQAGDRWAFFPGVPYSIRGLSWVSGLSITYAAVAFAVVTGLAACIGLWMAFRDEFGLETATSALALLVFFPAAFVLSMAYTEGAFLAASAFCLVAIKRQRWVLAGLLAGAAGIIRPTGAVTVLALIAAALVDCRRTRRWFSRPALAAGISILPILAWELYGWQRTGQVAFFQAAEKAWGAHFVWFSTPFRSLGRLLTSEAAWHSATDLFAGAALVFMAVGLLLMVRMHRRGLRLPIAWWVMTVGGVLGALSPFWASSVMRYSMAAFPLFAAYAVCIPRQWLPALLGAEATCEGAMGLLAFSGLADGHAVFAP